MIRITNICCFYRHKLHFGNDKIDWAAPLFELNYAPPPRDLEEFISTLYLFETDELVMDDIERADLGQFRHTITGGGDLLFKNGKHQIIHSASLYGPRNMWSRVVARGPIKMFGFGLLPAGWAALTGVDAFKYANTIVDAQSLAGAKIEVMAAQIRNAATLDDMTTIAVHFMRACIATAPAAPLWFIRAVDEWLEASLLPDIATLARNTGLSRRQIDLHTKHYYGATPNLLIRKYRALRTANHIAHGDGDLHDYVAEAYYDQSHCIRELKEFTGITPTALKTTLSRLTTLTFKRRRLAGIVSNLTASS